jgi:hypothetical protein
VYQQKLCIEAFWAQHIYPEETLVTGVVMTGHTIAEEC